MHAQRGRSQALQPHRRVGRRLLVLVAGALAASGSMVLAGRPAQAQVVTGVTLDAFTWDGDGSLRFTWTDPPAPEPGTYFEGGAWWIATAVGTTCEDNDGCGPADVSTVICEGDDLPLDGTPAYSGTCSPGGEAAAGAKAFLYLNVQGIDMDEWAEGGPFEVAVPDTGPSPPSSTTTAVPPPTTTTVVPPSSTTTTQVAGPQRDALVAAFASSCRATDPFYQWYAALQEQLTQTEALQTKTQHAMATLREENGGLDPGDGGSTRSTTIADELVIERYKGLQRQYESLGDKADRLRRQLLDAAPGAAQVTATCQAGAEATYPTTPSSAPGLTRAAGPPQAVEAVPGGEIAQARDTKAFVLVPWFVDIQSGAVYWTEHTTHFDCPFGWQTSAFKASFTIQRCHYVSTPTADVVLRGTAVTVEVKGATTRVSVYSGSASVSDLEGTQVVQLGPGQTSSVTAGQAPTTPTAFVVASVHPWWAGAVGFGSGAFLLPVGLLVLLAGFVGLLWVKRRTWIVPAPGAHTLDALRRRALLISAVGTFGPWLVVAAVVLGGGLLGTSHPSPAQISLGVGAAVLFVAAPVLSSVAAVRVLRAGGAGLFITKTTDTRVVLAQDVDETRMNCQKAMVDEGFTKVVSDPSGMITARRRCYGQFTATPVFVWVRPHHDGSVIDVHCKATAQSVAAMLRHPADVLVDRFLDDLESVTHTQLRPDGRGIGAAGRAGPGNGNGVGTGNGTAAGEAVNGNGAGGAGGPVEPPVEPSVHSTPPGPPAPSWPGSRAPGVNGLAIAALVLGLLWVFWIGSLLAVVFGHVALHQIRREGQQGRGMAVAGLVLGWVSLAVFVAAVIAVAVDGVKTEDQKPAVQILREAVSASERATAVHVTGTMTSSGGSARIDMVLTPNVVGGTVTRGGARADMVMAGGNVYLRGDATFWTSQGLGTDLAGRWVVVPDTSSDTSSLGQVAHVFDRLEPKGALAKGADTTIRGQQVVPVGNSSGTVFSVANSIEHPYVLRIVTSAADPEGAGQLDFDQYGTAAIPVIPTGAIPVSS